MHFKRPCAQAHLGNLVKMQDRLQPIWVGPESPNTGVISGDTNAAVPGTPLSKEARFPGSRGETQKTENERVSTSLGNSMAFTSQHHSTNCRGLPAYIILCLVSAWKVLSPPLHLAGAPLRKPFLNFQGLVALPLR